MALTPAPTATDVGPAPPPRGRGFRRALGPFAAPPSAWGDRAVFPLVVAVLALLYLGLYHPFWTRGGDTEVYLAMARHLVRGEGYRYNGNQVGLVPPLWPLVLAAGMWVTSVVGVLKLMLPALVLAWLGAAYFVLRRFAPPWACGLTILIVGSLQGVVGLTQQFFTEPLFLALSWGGLLLAMQSRDAHAAGRPWGDRAILACGLLALAIATRWTGVLWWPVLAAAFLHGRQLGRIEPGLRHVTLRLLPRRVDGMWLAVILSAVVALWAFYALRQWVRVSPWILDPRYSHFMAGKYELVNPHGGPTLWTHLERLAGAPQWLGVLYWNQLARTAASAPWAYALAAVTAVPLAVAGLVGLARGQWIWLGAAAAWVPVVATWPHAIDRYSMPVAPLLVLGTILGTLWLCRQLDARLPRRRWLWLVRRGPALLMLVPLAVLVGYNAGAYGLERWVANDLAARYEGGGSPSLHGVADAIRSAVPREAEVGVIRHGFAAEDLARWRYDEEVAQSRNLRRQLVWLIDRPAIELAVREAFDPQDPWLLAELRRRRIEYLVVGREWRPFAGHLHAAPWVRPAPPPQPRQTRLYRRTPEGLVEVPTADGEPVRLVPGLEDVGKVIYLRRFVPVRHDRGAGHRRRRR